jgi:dTDP-4-dehydrorhamnose reductase
MEILPYDLPAMDISDRSLVQEFLDRDRPDLVINAAAYTQVERAETEVEQAFIVNRNGPENLALACDRLRIPLVHISTDFVFDGVKKEPYLEDDPVSPINVYGRSKAEGEECVRRGTERHLIVRTSWLYSVYGHNFVTTMLRLGREKRVIRVVDDQFGCPTSAADLADALLKIAVSMREGRPIPWGTYHFCNSGIISWYQFAGQIFHAAGKYDRKPLPVLEPIHAAQYPSVVKRPAFSALNCGRIREAFGTIPRDWLESLETTVRRIFSG